MADDLVMAACRGECDEVAALLARAVDPNQRDGNGALALVEASGLGHAKVVKVD